MRGLVVAIAVGVLPISALSAGNSRDDRAEIRRAFETVFDQSRPLTARLPLVEDPDVLRSSAPKVAKYGIVKTRVTGARAYGRRAQVTFEFRDQAGRSLPNPVPFGVAVQQRGRWVVSRFTLCRLLSFVYTCPRRSSDGRYLGEPFDPAPVGGPDSHARSLTLPDGTGVAVTLPEGFDSSEWRIRPQATLDFTNVDGQHRTVDGTYRPATARTLTSYAAPSGETIALDYHGNLNFPLGRWIARIYAADLSEAQRAFLVQHAHFNPTGDGMFEYIGDAELPLKLPEPLPAGGPGRSAASRPVKGVLNITAGTSHVALNRVNEPGKIILARTECDGDRSIRQPFGASPDHPAGQRCLPGTGLELGAEGFDGETVDRLLTDTQVRVVALPVAARGVC